VRPGRGRLNMGLDLGKGEGGMRPVVGVCDGGIRLKVG